MIFLFNTDHLTGAHEMRIQLTGEKMNCSNCGTEFNADSEFCHVCSAPVNVEHTESSPPVPEEAIEEATEETTEETPKVATEEALEEAAEQPPSAQAAKSKNSRILRIVIPIAAVFLLAVSITTLFFTTDIFRSPAPAQQIQGTGFDTPEQAVLAYLEALRDTDIRRMMSIFAIESYNYDIESAVNQTGGFLTWSSPLPNVNEFVKALNMESRRILAAYSISQQNSNLYMADIDKLPPSFQSIDGSVPYVIEINRDSAEISAFVDSVRDYLDSTRFSTLEVLGFIPLEVLTDYCTDLNFNFMRVQYEQIVAQIEADEVTGSVAVFEMGGEKYIFSPDLVNYQGKWYILHLSGVLTRSAFAEIEPSILEHSASIFPIPGEFSNDFMAHLVQIELKMTPSKKTNSASEKAEGEGFETPEEAVETYIASFRDSDLKKMISTFAIESFVSNMDFETYLYETGAFMPWGRIYLDDNEFEYALNVELQRSDVANTIFAKYRYLCLSDLSKAPDPGYLTLDGSFYRATIGVDKDNEAEVSAFMDWISEIFDSLPLHSIKLHGFIPRESLVGSFLSENDLYEIIYEENRRAEVFGADMVIGCIAVMELDGDMLLFSPDTIRYGDKWYIISLSGGVTSNMLNMVLNPTGSFTFGEIMPIPAALYDVYPSLLTQE